LSDANTSSGQALSALQGSGLTPEQSHDVLNRLIDQQAFMLSANDVFYVSAWLFIALIAVVWLARPVRGAPPAGNAAAGAH
jgi:DHA2 family multidrug resistance protein